MTRGRKGCHSSLQFIIERKFRQELESHIHRQQQRESHLHHVCLLSESSLTLFSLRQSCPVQGPAREKVLPQPGSLHLQGWSRQSPQTYPQANLIWLFPLKDSLPKWAYVESRWQSKLPSTVSIHNYGLNDGIVIHIHHCIRLMILATLPIPTGSLPLKFPDSFMPFVDR